MAIAAVATAALCIGGTYTLLGDADKGSDIYVILDIGTEISFTEFEESTRTTVRASSSDEQKLSALDGNVSIIITASNLGDKDGITAEQLSDKLNAYYKTGDKAAAILINWLNTQDI